MSQSSKSKFKLVIALGTCVLAAYILYSRLSNKNPEIGERTGKVRQENLIQRVTIAGQAEPIRTTIVTTPYDGYIKKIYVKLGQGVQAGDPLVSVAQSLQASESVYPIRAPFTGTVTQVLKAEGQFSRQSDSKDFILRIDDLTKMFINANAPEIDVLKVKNGAEVLIKVSAILTKSYKGVVREIAQAATIKDQWGGRSQVEYVVKIEVLDADKELKPGMSAIVDIITNKKDSVLVLEHEFIQKQDQDYFVILKSGERRAVKVGLQNESVFEITEGLKSGEEVQQVDFIKLIGN